MLRFLKVCAGLFLILPARPACARVPAQAVVPSVSSATERAKLGLRIGSVFPWTETGATLAIGPCVALSCSNLLQRQPEPLSFQVAAVSGEAKAPWQLVTAPVPRWGWGPSCFSRKRPCRPAFLNQARSQDNRVHFVSFGTPCFNRANQWRQTPALLVYVKGSPMAGDDNLNEQAQEMRRVLAYLREMMDMAHTLRRPEIERQYADAHEFYAQIVYGPLPSRWQTFCQSNPAPAVRVQEDTTPKKTPGWKREMLAKPLRKVIATIERTETDEHSKRPIATTYEILECRHEHALYPGQESGKRRRCGVCAQEARKPQQKVEPSDPPQTARKEA